MKYFFSIIFLSAIVSTQAQAASPELLKSAVALEAQGKFQEASVIYKKIVQENPNDSEAICNLAGIYGKMQKFELELKTTEEGIEKDPKNPACYINKGNALAYLRKFPEAKESFLKAKALDPKHYLPIYSLGVMAVSQGDMDEAIKQYKECLNMDETNSDCRFNLATVYANQRNLKEAQSQLKILLKHNPKDSEASQMLKSISKKIDSLKK